MNVTLGAICLCITLSVYCNGDNLNPHIQGMLQKLLKTKNVLWKPSKYHVKSVIPVHLKVEVLSVYDMKGEIGKNTTNLQKYKDCSEILKANPEKKGTDGVYSIYPDGHTRKKVFCDMTTEGGGWTVIQKRWDGSTDFYRTWKEYKDGFGDPSKNYWIGNNVLNFLTKGPTQQLRIDLQRFNGEKGYAKYSRFSVGNEGSKFQLNVSGYKGTIGDCIPAYVGYGISLNISCKAMNPLYGLPLTTDTFTMFRQIPRPVNCESMFKGLYQFSYEINMGGGGICDNPDNQIKACQEPGSPYVDNDVFSMTYASCPNVLASKDKELRYQCMGTWDAEQHGMVYTFAAIADIMETEPRIRFQCLMTSKFQKGDEKRWVMSRFAECSRLNSIYSAPVRLVLKSIAPSMENMVSRCNLPSDLAGKWETKGPGFKFDVVINETNIRFQTEPNAVESLDSIFACQKKSGTRYLMKRFMAGECKEVFVCMDVVPQTNNTVRYRIGKPEQIPLDIPRGELDITRMFRNACHWFDRVGIKGNQGYEILSRKVNIN